MLAAEQRKLQVVYDDIDRLRYKPALVELNRYLKKQPKSQLALCLKVVCLWGCNTSHDEILAAYEVAKRYRPFTEVAAHSLQFAFKNMRRNDLVLELYQELFDEDPKNAAWAEKAFLAAAVQWDTKAMVQSSRRLATMSREPQIARWAAFSQLVEFGTLPTADDPCPTPAPPKSMLMASHFLKQSSLGQEIIASADILWLHLHTLLSDNQSEDAHKLLREQAKGGSLHRRWIRLKAMPVIGERIARGKPWDGWQEEWEWAKSMLLEFEDTPQTNFAYYRYLNDCLAQVLQADGNPQTHPLLIATRELLQDLERKYGRKERSPLLALLELEGRATPVQASSTQDFLDMIERYWDAWGSFSPTCDDLDGVIPAEKFDDVMELFRLTTREDHTDLVTFKRQLALETMLAARRPASQITLDIAKRHWALYQSSLKYGENLGKDDVQHADPAAYMAVHGLLAFADPVIDTETRLLQAAACLEAVIEKASAAFYARFLLVRIYRYLGAIALSVPHVKAMKVTEIQLSSLLHVFIERTAVECRLAGIFETYESYIDLIGSVRSRTISDLDNAKMTAMQCESYSKISGIISLRTTLLYSAHSFGSDTELFLSRVQKEPREVIEAFKAGGVLKDLPVLSGPLHDTRDWDMVPNLGPAEVRLKELTQPEKPITSAQVYMTARALRRLQSIWSEEAEQVEEPLEDGACFLADLIESLYQQLSRRVATDEEVKAITLEPFASVIVNDITSAPARDLPRLSARVMELRSILNLVIIGTESSHWKGKPKKDQQALATLHAELRDAKKAFDAQVQASIKAIDERKKPDATAALLPEQPLDGVRKEVLKAREASWISFRKMMKKQ